jgi:D-alanyl-D-alanine carboxypeptidase
MRQFGKLIFFICIFLFLGLGSCRNASLPRQNVNDLSLSPKPSYTGLDSAVVRLLDDPALKDADAGILILDITSGIPDTIIEHLSERPLMPGSVMKVVTTATALEMIGDTLDDYIWETNQYSRNHMANALLREIGKKEKKEGSRLSGAAAIKDFWKTRGIDLSNAVIRDGSGWSRKNELTCSHLASILYYMRKNKHFGAFYESLPVAGMTGTMRHICKGTEAQGRIRSKTGTLWKVKSFTGYARTKSNREFLFAIIINNFSCWPDEMVDKLAPVLISLASI